MAREQTKEILPIIQTFAEGKTIQDWTNDTWKDKEYTSFGELSQSPIKPQPKYRPFEDTAECWEEMHKHSDFGWVKCKDSKSQYHICAVSHGYISVLDADPSFFESFGRYEFLDGTPFGIKEE